MRDLVQCRDASLLASSSLDSRRSLSQAEGSEEVESECEKKKLRFVIERLVTFVRAGVGNWPCDLDASLE